MVSGGAQWKRKVCSTTQILLQVFTDHPTTWGLFVRFHRRLPTEINSRVVEGKKGARLGTKVEQREETRRERATPFVPLLRGPQRKGDNKATAVGSAEPHIDAVRRLPLGAIEVCDWQTHEQCSVSKIRVCLSIPSCMSTSLQHLSMPLVCLAQPGERKHTAGFTPWS